MYSRGEGDGVCELTWASAHSHSRNEVNCECAGLSSTPPYLTMCLFSPSPDTSPAFPDAA